MGKISASLMCANLFNLENDINLLEAMQVDFLHLDIMDGHYVKNVTLGIELVNKIKYITKLPRDIHLLVENPLEFSKMINLCSNDMISFHFDSTDKVDEIIRYVRSTGSKVGITLNVETPIGVLEPYISDIDYVNLMMISPGFAGQPMKEGMISKISSMKEYLIKNNNNDVLIEVDGNVSFLNAIKMKEAGGNIFVAGSSSVFNKEKDIKENIKRLYECIKN